MTKERLQSLLDAWYEGTISPAEEAEIKLYFSQTDEVDEEFKADAAIFRAMSRKAPASPPADLGPRIVRATVGRRPRIMRILLSAAGVAAAIALVVTLMVGIPQPQETGYPVIARVSPAEDSSDAINAAHQINARASRPVKVVEISADDNRTEHSGEQSPATREVTDPDEAAEIAAQVLQGLAKAFSKSDKGLKATGIAMSMVVDPVNSAEIMKNSF